MSDTRANVRRRIRLITDDMNPNSYALDSERLDTLIESRMHFIAQEVGLGPLWVASAVTLTTADYTYTLPTSIEYQRVIALRLASQNWLMERITRLELLALRLCQRSGIHAVPPAPVIAKGRDL